MTKSQHTIPSQEILLGFFTIMILGRQKLGKILENKVYKKLKFKNQYKKYQYKKLIFWTENNFQKDFNDSYIQDLSLIIDFGTF